MSNLSLTVKLVVASHITGPRAVHACFDFKIAAQSEIESKWASKMTDSDDVTPALDATIDRMLALMNLKIDESWRPEILANFQVNLRMARLVLDFPLGDDADAAPVFRP